MSQSSSPSSSSTPSTPQTSSIVTTPYTADSGKMSPAVTIIDERMLHEQRIEKVKMREERIKENRIKADEFVQSGDDMFEKGEYTQACYFYSDAIRMWNTNVELYVKLATACVKNRQYEQAAFTATRALTLNPKNTEARYQRGLARLEQGLYKPAHVDFTTILKHVPTHTLAATALEKVNVCLPPSTSSSSTSGVNNQSPSSSSPPAASTAGDRTLNEGKEGDVVAEVEAEDGKAQGTKPAQNSVAADISAEQVSVQVEDKDLEEEEEEELDFDFPRHEEVELDIADLSDSEDCRHVGTRGGVPCRFYNKGKMGCQKGVKECGFSHAPDEKSVRDNLGRNVCVYLLLGSCRYEDRCVYSHDKEWLSTSKGWWTDSAQIERMRDLVALAEKNAKQRRELSRHLHYHQGRHLQQRYQRNQNLQSMGGQDRSRRGGRRMNEHSNTNNMLSATGNAPQRQPNRYNTRKRGQGNRGTAAAPAAGYDPTSSRRSRIEEGIHNLGFSQDEVEELVSQWGKPWDDDARDVMHALSYI